MRAKFTIRVSSAREKGTMEAISNYLESGRYPEGLSKSQKRDLRKRAATLMLTVLVFIISYIYFTKHL